MNDRTLQSNLTQWIRKVFRRGLVLGEDVVCFMESAFGSGDIRAVLSGSHDSEIDSLLELLCYPDHGLQVRFESQWGQQAFSSDDLATVISALGETSLETDIVSPEGSLLARIDVPPFALEAFVQRLKITWQPPSGLTRTLTGIHPEDRRLTVRVHLRNAGLEWHEGRVRLMDLYLTKMSAESEHFEPCLVFLISLLSELDAEIDGYDFLIAKKFFYFNSLCRAEDYERKRQSSNMEIMILQGTRAAHGSIDEWRRNMRRIDQICRALFGQTQFFQQPGEHSLDLGKKDPAGQVQDVMRFLS